MPGYTACKLTQWPNLESQCNSDAYIVQSLEVNVKISNHCRFKSLNAFIKYLIYHQIYCRKIVARHKIMNLRYHTNI